MAAGDVVSGHASVNNGAYLDIQPGAGAEWIIHNLFYGGAAEIYRTNGSNDVKIDSDTALGCMMGRCFHVTNSIYLRIKNVSGGAVYCGHDGVVTK